jgi:hypothetical protein
LPTTTLPPLCFNNDDCDDGLFCNGEEKCRVFRCVPGDPLVVPDDGVGCTVDRCDEDSRRIVHEPDDSACADDDQCTRDKCDAALGCVHSRRTGDCDDGVACTTNDRCVQGVCVGEPDCPDGTLCNNVSGTCVANPEVGCSVNFWKDNPGDWGPTTIAPDELFDERFGVSAFDPDITLMEALGLQNSFGTRPDGKATVKIPPALARQAVAALLNARYPDLNFPLSKEDVRDAVKRVLDGKMSTQDALEMLSHANALGCPLGEDARVGDANKDGIITASDALMTLRAAVGSDECALAICDVDGNGTITAADALEVLRAAVGMEQL